MAKVYNFSAGPSVLPAEVLKKAQEELIDYRGTGISVMEMSHRSKDFELILQTTEQRLRELMGIPDSYSVLFLQGGASTQFAMVPLNLLRRSRKADYVLTGSFAEKAIREAEKFGTVAVAASSEDQQFRRIPDLPNGIFDPQADYVHITMNNTIYGTRFTDIPDTGAVPLVSDVSSCVLSEPIDVSRFGLLYAGAQKNIAPAGLTIVIIRNDLVGYAGETTPTMLDYQTHVEKKSMYNTPPCYNIYLAGLVFEWLLRHGGLERMGTLNTEKAELLYHAIDRSRLYRGTAEPKYRSLMNATFVLARPDLTEEFVQRAAQEGLISLKGHRSVGGLRASIYNAMPLEAVKSLVRFMEKFERQRG